MALSTMLTNFANYMERFFAAPGRMEGTPESKRRTSGKGDAGESQPQVQAQWVKDGMAAAFAAFGEAVDNRAQVIEESKATQKQQISNLEAQVQELQEQENERRAEERRVA